MRVKIPTQLLLSRASSTPNKGKKSLYIFDVHFRDDQPLHLASNAVEHLLNRVLVIVVAN